MSDGLAGRYRPPPASPHPSIRGPVGVVGLGVMGGSLARALSARGVIVRGYSPDRAEAEAAREAGAVATIASSVEESARGVAWWIVAVPLSALAEVVAEGARAAPPRVMDLVSLQRPPLEVAEAAGLALCYRSAHPMVGSERSGFAASRPDLFDGATVWLSAPRGRAAGGSAADDATPRRLDEETESFWTMLGAHPAWCDPSEHDHRMAAASHLPQLTANLLARLLEAEGVGSSDLGPGGLDMTRLAGSSPALWTDLLRHAGPDVAPLLRQLAGAATTLARDLEAGDLEAVGRLLTHTRRWRDA